MLSPAEFDTAKARLLS
ncbi:MAG: hypothetical protein ABI047_13935 [Jatrophihabitantaceae bacterium]